jgi:transcriptional regulator with XRE-family HTH domain
MGKTQDKGIIRSDPDRMTGDELQGWIDRYGYTQRSLAAALGINERTLRRWVSEDHAIPPMIPLVLTQLAARKGK